MREVIDYVWLNQALLAMLPWNVDRDVAALVRSGGVAYELLRPLDLYNHWFARAAAWRIAPTVLRAVPMAVLAGLFFGLGPPPSWPAAGMFALTLAGGLLLSCALTVLLNLSLLWTTSGEGVTRVAAALITLLSGSLIPLPLLPDWAQPVLRALPFAAMRDMPFRVYSGHIAPSEAWSVLARQAVWAVLLIALGRAVLARATRRLVVQGG
jgi:ABC-2 type transport system permease protein